ncbi:tetratricopeptide repeat-containing protein [Shewanella ulleungensis]|uniref:Tetratricopeptide repeat protein n=1 Tax=Shewanella ulleungensis TaxID=2282699 RepID=A0ABQ2QDL2_9GAMM|nr:tetratricopeptide repeat-containing protein [Shewanella ulleungensis]MCL1148886.1 DUF4071 domain-containing protein [Shewanella ulleungensis]GGP75004.1 hypothetical protein GCM10009410_03670 [Shewanella ulleungensis]
MTETADAIQLINLYQPDIVHYSTEHLALQNDLINLQAVYDAGATEAVVFYAGRILEALSAEGVSLFGEQSKTNVFANLEYLNDFHIFDFATLHWAHALRRQANQVRHLLGKVEAQDSDIAVALLDSWLGWYFSKFPLGLCLKQYRTNKQQNNVIHQLVDDISQQMANTQVNEQVLLLHPLVQQSPVFSSILIESLINKDQLDTAGSALHTTLVHHPEDLRLLQLNGLYFSRKGMIDEATEQLSSLYKSLSNDDETIGIYAGVLKKTWQKNPANTEALKRACRMYDKGWQQSKQRNTYLGINAAAINLWQGHTDKARDIALSIVKQFQHKKHIIEQKQRLNNFSFNFWELATIGEALYITGQQELALQHYQSLFAANAHPIGKLRVAAKQLIIHFSYITPSNTLNKLAKAVLY